MTDSHGDTPKTPQPLRVAVLGTGRMGGILLQAFLKSGLVTAANAFPTVAHPERATTLSTQFGVTVTTDNLAAAGAADVILLGVKPTQIEDLVRSIKPALKGQLLISFAASVKTRAIEDAAGFDQPVIRAMPNTPAMVDAAITALCGGRFATPEHLALAQRIFSAVGRTVVVDEKH